MCDCPSDWVLCFRRDCERRGTITRMLAEQHERTFHVLGDQTKGVTIPANNHEK